MNFIKWKCEARKEINIEEDLIADGLKADG